tara:strand:+ start:281 stop:568 length:288 start_codon:yes stop_codon:yes gene_type:complete
MPEYSSKNFLTATSADKLPISTRVDYGFSEFIYQAEGKWPPDNEKKKSLFTFYKNLISTYNWTPLHFFEYLRNGDLRKTLNENGFDWVILSTEAF